MPCQCHQSNVIFLRNLDRNIPTPRKLFYNPQQADRKQHETEQKPNRALVAISIDDTVSAIVNGNPVRQRGVTACRPARISDQQCTTQAVYNPCKPSSLQIAVSLTHFLIPREIRADYLLRQQIYSATLVVWSVLTVLSCERRAF